MDWGRIALGAGTMGMSEGGGLRSIFGSLGGGNPNFSNMQDAINQRNSQIDEFSNQLAAARGNVLANYQNLNTATMARFAPAFEASLAGRGLTPSGGAFASGVGQEAAKLQSGYDQLNAGMTERDLTNVANMRAGMFPAQMGLAQQQMMLPYQRQQAMMSALGGLAGTAVGGLTMGPFGAMAGNRVGSNLLGGGGGNYPNQPPIPGNLNPFGNRNY